MVISLAFKLRILIDDIFQSRKHKTLMRSLRVQRSKLVVRPWHPDISMHKCFHRGQVVKFFFFSRETSFISWLLCLFFRAGQRIWYLTSASFKNFIRCDSCSHVPFRFTFTFGFHNQHRFFPDILLWFQSNQETFSFLWSDLFCVFFLVFFFFFFFFPFFSFFLFLRCIIACIELWGLHFQRHWTKSKGNRQSWSVWSMSWGNWYHFQIIFCARENETNQIHCLEHTMVVTLFLAFRMFLCWLLTEIAKIRCNLLFVECPSSSCNLDQLPWTGAN